MDKRIKGLDVLRLLAVLAVVAFHYAYRGAAADGLTQLSVPAWHPVARYGYLGVHLFFVISGFVIARSTAGRSTADFVLARFIRIYPAFLICMSVTFAVTVLIGQPVFTASLKQWAANLAILAPALHQPFMDGAYWSIVYEIIFYGWVALLLTRRVFDRHSTTIVLIAIAIATGNELLGPSMAVRRLFLTDASGFFLCGMLIHRLYVGARARDWMLLALAAELAAGQAIVVSRYNVVHYGVDLSKGTIVAIALGSIALVGLCTQLRHEVVPPRVAVAIGGMTYPLYLLHQHIGFMVFNRLGALAPPVVLVIGTMLAMLVAAFAVYALVEKPIQARLKRWLAPLVAGSRLGSTAPFRAKGARQDHTGLRPGPALAPTD